MTDDEKLRFEKMEDLISDIHRALKGGDNLSIDEKGLVETVKELRREVAALKDQLRTLRNIFKGISIGLAVAALLFGAASWESFIKFLKAII